MIKDIILKDDSVAIIGFHEGGAGQIYEWIKGKYHIACFVNYNDDIIDENLTPKECKSFEYPKNGKYKGIPLISSQNYYEILKKLNINRVIITIPEERMRMVSIKQAKQYGMELISVIHPSVTLLEECKIGNGVILFPNVVVGYKTEVRDGVIINIGSSIDHHSIICECVTIDPGVVTAGNVVVEECAHIHTGVTIINKIRVGQDAIVGAGSVLIKDVEPYSVNVGVPSRVIKYRESF